MATATAGPLTKKASAAREPMRVPMSIEHVDGHHSGNYANELERNAIRSTPCLNCSEPFEDTSKILYVITMQGLIWWHRNRCGMYDA